MPGTERPASISARHEGVVAMVHECIARARYFWKGGASGASGAAASETEIAQQQQAGDIYRHRGFIESPCAQHAAWRHGGLGIPHIAEHNYGKAYAERRRSI